jgi:hypothetical protein
MIATVALAMVLAAGAPPIDEDTLGQRMVVGRVGAIVAFGAIVGGLGYGLRVLTRRARQEEEAERLDEAFREVERELSVNEDEKEQ